MQKFGLLIIRLAGNYQMGNFLDEFHLLNLISSTVFYQHLINLTQYDVLDSSRFLA